MWSCAVMLGAGDPLDMLEQMNRDVVTLARYLRQSISEIEAMPLPQIQEYLRLTCELIRAENHVPEPGDPPPGMVAPAPSPLARGSFAHEESVR